MSPRSPTEDQAHPLNRSYSARQLAELLHGDTPGDVLYPTPEQIVVIESGLEPMLVIAGAGSGKTKTMADRVVWLVANGLVRPEQILGVTFTRKAAGELATRIRQRLAQFYRVTDPVPENLVHAEERLEPTVSTYHSYANSIVSDYGLRVGVERDATMLGGAQAWQLANQIVEAYTGAFDHLTAAKSTLVQAVLKMASECAEHLRSTSDVRDCLFEHLSTVESLEYKTGSKRAASLKVDQLLRKLRTRITVTELVDQYMIAKRQRSQLDYGDLVAVAAEIARSVPAAVETERLKFKVVLLDEFQDTSSAQLTLFANLFGDGRSVTAVGDPHQSIYGFRGASAGQLADFRMRFPIAEDSGYRPAHVAHLSIAWRNSRAILGAANTVSASLGKQAPWLNVQRMPPVPLLRERPGAPVGEVLIARYLSDDKSPSLEVEVGEAVGVAHLVEQQRQRAFDHHPDGRPLTPTVAVLCRGKRQFEPIRRELEERGIPVQVVGLGGLLSTPEVVDLLAVLRVLGDPGRSDAMLRILANARWRIGPIDLMTLSDWSRHLARMRERPKRDTVANEGVVVEHDMAEAGSLVEAVDYLPKADWTSSNGRSLSESGRARLNELGRELRVLREYVGQDMVTLISEIEHTTRLDIEVAAKPGVDFHAARRNLDAFTQAAASFTATADKVDLQAFLAWLDAAETEENGLPVTQLEASRDAVQLLTVHASKGLEWDIVVVPGLNEGSFPSGKDSRWSSGESAIPWNLRGDAPDLPQWDWQQEDQYSWLESEKLFCEDARGHAEREERRLAYVAFTRARHVLICSGSVWGNGRAKPSAASRYLEELAECARAGEEGFSLINWVAEDDQGLANPASSHPELASWPFDPLGDRRSLLEHLAGEVQLAAASEPVPAAEGTIEAELDRETDLVLAQHKDADSTVEVELPPHISASVLVGLSEDPDRVIRQLRRPVPRKPGLAARKGTAFHEWIENFYGRAGQLELEVDAEPRDSYIDETYDLDAMAKTFSASVWARRTPTAIEVPIETTIDNVVVRGRIDAVFQDADGGWDLIDWKTGRVPTGQELRVRSVQLAVYRHAWAQLKGVSLEMVRAAFYYVGEDKTVRPHDLADQTALEAILSSAYS